MKKFCSTIIMVLALICVCSSCSVTLSGASIPLTMKNIYVGFFENNAPLVVSNLSQAFTDALKSRVRSQTRLAITQNPEADGTLTGAITGYSIAPVAVQATNGNAPPLASQTRLSITVSVKYVNAADKKLNFDQSFTRFADYTGELSSQEQALIQNINQQLTEDIFNRAFANW